MRRWIELLIAIIAIAGGVLVARQVQSRFTPTQGVTSVMVPATDIPPYTLITLDQIKSVDMPSSALLHGYAYTADQIIGRVALGRLPAGVPIPTALLSAPADFRPAPKEEELFVLPISPGLAAGGQIHAGERVRIYDIRVQKDTGQGTARLIVELPALAILDSGGAAVSPSLPLSSTAAAPGAPALMLSAAPPADVPRILADVAAAQQAGGLTFTVAPLYELPTPTPTPGAGPTLAPLPPAAITPIATLTPEPIP